MSMNTYVVRVYRRDADEPHELVGTIEEVETQEKQQFRHLSELIAILSGMPERKAARPPQEPAAIDQRRANRLRLMLPVVVSGIDRHGRMFTENAVLSDMSSLGACCLLSRQVRKGDELKLLIEPDRSALSLQGRVVRQKITGEHKLGIGVAFQ